MQFFPMHANFALDSLTSFILCFSLLLGNVANTFNEIYIYIHIYKYIFRSNSRGLTPLGPSWPDKFINLATLGPRGIKWQQQILQNDCCCCYFGWVNFVAHLLSFVGRMKTQTGQLQQLYLEKSKK